METKNLAIMLTDIKGFTSKTAGFSRAQTQELLEKHRDLVLPVIVGFRGRLVKTIGDAFLAVFNSPTDAVLCGVKIQEALAGYNADKANSDKIEIRIAINSGEVAVHDDGDIYGDAVNVVSRLESIAEVGQVFFTEAVYLAMNKREVPSSEIGYRTFKGVAERVKVYRVLREVPVGELGVGTLPGQETAPGAADPVIAGPAAPGGQRLFWRRTAALLTDITIFLILLGALGVSTGPVIRWTKTQRPAVKAVQDAGPANDTFVGNVSFSKDGVIVKLKDGRDFSLNSRDSDKVLQLSRRLIAGRHAGKDGIFVRGELGQWFIDGENGIITARLAHPRPGSLLETEGLSVSQAPGKKMPFKMLLWALYCSILVWRFGATPGKMILHLRVTDRVTGEKPSADQAFLRSFFSLVSMAPFLLGYAWALGKEGKTWHDLISNTEVRKSYKVN